MAAPVAGCDPNVLKAMQDKAQAKVAYDTSVADQIVKKPDSVLAMTCFNQAAGVSASQGGSVFSGDFSAQLSPIVTNTLTSAYANFGGAEGKSSNTVDYSSTALANSFNCNGMQNLWNDSQTSGIHQDVPYITADEMMNAAPPAGSGADMQANWNAAASQGVFSKLQADTAALPKPQVTDFSNAGSSCAVLQQAGIMQGPCPGTP